MQESGAVAVDLGRNRALLRGAVVKLAPQEAELLAMLAQGRGQVMAADRLMQGLWGNRKPETAEVRLRGLVLDLRRKLRPRDFDIACYRRQGYELVDHVLMPKEVKS